MGEGNENILQIHGNSHFSIPSILWSWVQSCHRNPFQIYSPTNVAVVDFT